MYGNTINQAFDFGGGVLLTLGGLLMTGQAQALSVGPDGRCPTNSTPDQSHPGQCILNMDSVPVTGSNPTSYGFDFPWWLYYGREYTPAPVNPSSYPSGQGAVSAGTKAQALQKSPCDKDAKSGGTKSAGQGIQVTGRPVMIATGTKYLPEVDIAPIGGGVALGVGRTYTKGNTKYGAFGQAWSASFDYTLVFEYENYVCWAWLSRIAPCAPNGKPLLVVHAYSPSGYATNFRLVNGSWTSGKGDTLQQVGADWVVNYADGARHVFDANGRPKTIKDERGIGLTYAYSGPTRFP